MTVCCYRCSCWPCECADGCAIVCGDCRDVLPELEAASTDAIITDPPYGITRNKWDLPVPFAYLWPHFNSLLNRNGVVVLTASQPFTSLAVATNLAWFKHEWIWIKNRGSNFANTVREPMKEHESILVFAPEKWTYNKQMQKRTGGGLSLIGKRVTTKVGSTNTGKFAFSPTYESLPELRVPSSWQKFNTETGLHPTQKPVALMAYMVKTYTNEGGAILDAFMGSGTTLVAAKQLGRRAIGIEIEDKYCEIAANRLANEPMPLFTEVATA